jgi:hypothetical protein
MLDPESEHLYLRRRLQQWRFQIVALSLPGLIGLLLLLYRFMVGGKESAFAGSASSLIIVTLMGMSGVGLLMLYLQSPQYRQRRFDDDSVNTALMNEVRYDSSRNRAEVEMLGSELKSLKAQLDTVSSSKEALTKEQTAGLVENVKKRIEAEASKQIIEELRLSVQSDSRLKDVLAYARETAERLNREVAALSRRGNLNLSIGIITTVGGLGVLAYVVFQVNQLPKETWAVASHYVPRLSLVLFIELFAYFFLRLYKSSLGEIKYFQNELTNVESKRLALIVALNQGDLATVTKVIEDLAKTERNFILERGQTTVELEKSRVENESSVNVLEKAASVLEKLQPSKK